MFWRTRNYEKELELLGEKIKQARASAQKSKLNSRRYRSLYILYSLAAYLCYAAVGVSSKSYRTVEGKLYLVGIPLVIYLVYRLLSLAVLWREGRASAHLEAIQHRRDGLIEEYKDKINYSQIQKVLSTGKDESQATKKQASAKLGATPKPKGKAEAPKGPINLSQESAALLEKARIDKPKKTPVKKAPEWPAQPAQPAQVAPGPTPPQFMIPREPMTTSHSWLDRLADLVLGENETSPNSRHALICPVCYNHNGLASYGQDPKDVTYRCPVCGTMHGKPKPDSEEVLGEQASASKRSAKHTDTSANANAPREATKSPEMQQIS